MQSIPFRCGLFLKQKNWKNTRVLREWLRATSQAWFLGAPLWPQKHCQARREAQDATMHRPTVCLFSIAGPKKFSKLDVRSSCRRSIADSALSRTRIEIAFNMEIWGVGVNPCWKWCCWMERIEVQRLQTRCFIKKTMVNTAPKAERMGKTTALPNFAKSGLLKDYRESKVRVMLSCWEIMLFSKEYKLMSREMTTWRFVMIWWIGERITFCLSPS